MGADKSAKNEIIQTQDTEKTSHTTRREQIHFIYEILHRQMKKKKGKQKEKHRQSC